MDECFKIQKGGPNSVISMLDYYFKNYVTINSNLIIYADNCPGQNKNQTVIGYLSYLVKISKYLKSIQID